MLKYETPKIEIILFKNEDVIITSGELIEDFEID